MSPFSNLPEHPLKSLSGCQGTSARTISRRRLATRLELAARCVHENVGHNSLAHWDTLTHCDGHHACATDKDAGKHTLCPITVARKHWLLGAMMSAATAWRSPTCRPRLRSSATSTSGHTFEPIRYPAVRHLVYLAAAQQGCHQPKAMALRLRMDPLPDRSSAHSLNLLEHQPPT